MCTAPSACHHEYSTCHPWSGRSFPLKPNGADTSGQPLPATHHIAERPVKDQGDFVTKRPEGTYARPSNPSPHATFRSPLQLQLRRHAWLHARDGSHQRAAGTDIDYVHVLARAKQCLPLPPARLGRESGRVPSFRGRQL
jgi:hypothetical protein